MWDGDGQPLVLILATRYSVHGSEKGLRQRHASACGHPCGSCLRTMCSSLRPRGPVPACAGLGSLCVWS